MTLYIYMHVFIFLRKSTTIKWDISCFMYMFQFIVNFQITSDYHDYGYQNWKWDAICNKCNNIDKTEEESFNGSSLPWLIDNSWIISSVTYWYFLYRWWMDGFIFIDKAVMCRIYMMNLWMHWIYWNTFKGSINWIIYFIS